MGVTLNHPRNYIMANIGTFTAQNDSFTGGSHPDAQRHG